MQHRGLSHSMVREQKIQPLPECVSITSRCVSSPIPHTLTLMLESQSKVAAKHWKPAGLDVVSAEIDDADAGRLMADAAHRHVPTMCRR